MCGSLWQEENQISWVRCCVCAAPLVYGAAESNRALSARRRRGNSQLAAESRAAISASISAGHAVGSALPPVLGTAPAWMHIPARHSSGGEALAWRLLWLLRAKEVGQRRRCPGPLLPCKD